MFAAHVAPAATVSFNPLLGSGGNAGRREFSKGWNTAVGALAPANRKRGGVPDAIGRLAELRALLTGEPTSWTLDLNAASWFSEANKLYNSGQRPFRDGAISPWAMALACEGLVCFAGGASRRLGARARAAGAFPFVVQAAAPTTTGEAGRDLGEVWAPIWNRPMTVPEVTALFSRGRAEIGGRGALTPSAFAVAIMRRGVDAGITEFRRFALGRTTSANTFEPRFEGAIRVPARPAASSPAIAPSATALERLLGLIDRLPRDRKEGTRWRFLGLRGPVEAAMLRATGSPYDPEAACALLDAAVCALDRVDASKQFRRQNVTWNALPVEWVRALAGDEFPTEGRLALALVSAFPAKTPFALYRFGVELRFGGSAIRFHHPETPPARWVWRPGPLPRGLAGVIHRRTLDWEQENREDDGKKPVFVQIAASTSDLELWLSGLLDEELLARWLSRFALFDWRYVPREIRLLSRSSQEAVPPSAALSLYGILHPLFDLRPLYRKGDRTRKNLMPPEGGARTPAAARRIAGLLRGGDIAGAFEIAQTRYAMARAPFGTTDVPWAAADPERLLASLLFPVSNPERTKLIERWLRPHRHTSEDDNV